MTDDSNIPAVFSYRAQAADGAALEGTLEADSAEAATYRLRAMGLTVLSLSPAPPTPTPSPSGAKRLVPPATAADFAAFNQQLALLAEANMPLEHGLRLIADDMKQGRLADSVRAVAADLEAGRPLPQAFERHRGRFPAMYSRIVEVGLANGNLASVLLNVSRHLAMTQRLRAAIWRAVSYPLMVLVAMALVMAFVGLYVVPQFAEIYRDWDVELPRLTEVVTTFWLASPVIVIAMLLAIAAFPTIWQMMRAAGQEGRFIEVAVLPLPIIGRMLKRNYAARWCDLVGLCVEAGMDLPRAISMAGEAIGIPSVIDDSNAMCAAVELGGKLTQVRRLNILPMTTPRAMASGIQRGTLGLTLRTLRDMYEMQADHGLGALRAVLPPILLILMALVIGFTIMGLFLPLVRIICAVSG